MCFFSKVPWQVVSESGGKKTILNIWMSEKPATFGVEIQRELQDKLNKTKGSGLEKKKARTGCEAKTHKGRCERRTTAQQTKLPQETQWSAALVSSLIDFFFCPRANRRLCLISSEKSSAINRCCLLLPLHTSSCLQQRPQKVA